MNNGIKATLKKKLLLWHQKSSSSSKRIFARFQITITLVIYANSFPIFDTRIGNLKLVFSVLIIGLHFLVENKEK